MYQSALMLPLGHRAHFVISKMSKYLKNSLQYGRFGNVLVIITADYDTCKY